MKWGKRGGVAALLAAMVGIVWFMFGLMDWLRLG